MTLPKLRIEGGAMGKTTKILLNGTEIPGVREFEFLMNMTDVNSARFTINVGSIEVDAETVTEIIAGFDPAAKVSKLP